MATSTEPWTTYRGAPHGPRTWYRRLTNQLVNQFARTGYTSSSGMRRTYTPYRTFSSTPISTSTPTPKTTLTSTYLPPPFNLKVSTALTEKSLVKRTEIALRSVVSYFFFILQRNPGVSISTSCVWRSSTQNLLCSRTRRRRRWTITIWYPRYVPLQLYAISPRYHPPHTHIYIHTITLTHSTTPQILLADVWTCLIRMTMCGTQWLPTISSTNTQKLHHQ